ncbi:MAG TPA: phytoene/squalene synthase family protein [Puia sp.]|nr:phytoene/squalene synthase family protein [Puia sp.]
MIDLFHKVSQQCSKITTEVYSTSFASAIRLLHKNIRNPVYNIYGFVRFADEIVDTFHEFEKEKLLRKFKEETYNAIDHKVSLNPILHSFQITFHEYGIDRELIEFFFESMEMDLTAWNYDQARYKKYIYGSAEVVGLMCLHVFCEGNKDIYYRLKPFAQSLGAAFQKVNFLRDIKADYHQLKRSYFPDVDFGNFTESMKTKIINEIEYDFEHSYNGILQLPEKARFGVYVAYRYYLSLFKKIKQSHSSIIANKRIRISDYHKAMIVVYAGLKSRLKLI